MTELTLAARNLLAQDAELKALLGKSQSWDTWIFSERPVGVKIENTSKCMIVINEQSEWTTPNEHNTQRFPRLLVDIWADPTRNQDKSVKKYDAQTKIIEIQKLVDRHFHLVDLSTSQGQPILWGTAEEIANKTGVLITGSSRRSGPDFSPVRDSEDSFMGRYVYAVNTI